MLTYSTRQNADLLETFENFLSPSKCWPTRKNKMLTYSKKQNADLLEKAKCWPTQKSEMLTYSKRRNADLLGRALPWHYTLIHGYHLPKQVPRGYKKTRVWRGGWSFCDDRPRALDRAFKCPTRERRRCAAASRQAEAVPRPAAVATFACKRTQSYWPLGVYRGFLTLSGKASRMPGRLRALRWPAARRCSCQGAAATRGSTLTNDWPVLGPQRVRQQRFDSTRARGPALLSNPTASRARRVVHARFKKKTPSSSAHV